MVKKLLIPIIFIILLVLLGAGFFVTKKESEPTKEAPQELSKIIITESSLSNSPLRIVIKVIRDQEFDKKYGLELEGKSVPAVEGFRALLSGEVNIGQITPNVVAKANASSDKKVRMFAKGFKIDTHIATLQDSEAQSLEDLVGKKLGSFPRVSAPYNMFLVVANQLGYDLEKDFEVITGPLGSQQILLERGEVDALITAEITFARYVAENQFQSVFSVTDIWNKEVGINIPYVGWAASEEWLAEHKKEAVAFRKAWHDASKYITDHPEMFDDPEIQEFIELKKEKEADLLKEIFPKILQPSWTQKDIDDSRNYLDKLKKLGVIEESASTDVFILLEE